MKILMTIAAIIIMVGTFWFTRGSNDGLIGMLGGGISFALIMLAGIFGENR